VKVKKNAQIAVSPLVLEREFEKKTDTFAATNAAKWASEKRSRRLANSARITAFGFSLLPFRLYPLRFSV